MNIASHLAEQERLLALEYDYEKQEYQQLCQQTGIPRRISQGKCWYPVVITRTFRNAFDQPVVDVLRTEAMQVLLPAAAAAPRKKHKTARAVDPEPPSPAAENEAAEADPAPEEQWEFEPGRPVSFFRLAKRAADGEAPDGTLAAAEAALHGRTVFFPYACQVTHFDGQHLHVSLPSMEQAEVLREYAREGLLGVQIAFDATTYRVMREALSAFKDPADRALLHLRDVLIGDTAPAFRSLPPVSLPWLNASQVAAVEKVLAARDVAIVHGPPGTGKTTTLVEAISETLRREPQVMVSADSNAAVDWITEQLLARGLSVLRIGNPLRVSDRLLSATYERRFAAHPAYADLWASRQAVRQLTTTLAAPAHSPAARGRLQQQLEQQRNRITALEIQINEDLFAQSRVIACTLIGSAARVLERRHFSTLFIDEAAQALEAACYVAIRHADRVCLAGDHQQLPPTLMCPAAQHAGLGRSLIERLARQKPDCVTLLTVQYRMHRHIMQFSSDWFYHHALTAAPSCAERTIFPFDTPLVWIDTSQLGLHEQTHATSLSRHNTEEAVLLVGALRIYAEKAGIARLVSDRVDFGIISPYKSQVQLLRKHLRQENALRPLLPAISVGTVDGFQGQERDVILLSMVRGNDNGEIGFLSDLRRMNVALTRARMKLIVVGDTATLGHTLFYRRLAEHFATHGKLLVIPPFA